MTLATRWTCTPYSFEQAERLAAGLGISRATASMLIRRGYETADAGARFLAADERHDPALLRGIDDVCALVLAHVERGSHIVVHGDYDVDGVCATAVLVESLRSLGADPRWHLPARADGYGLSMSTVEALARAGTRLLITADCGVTAVDEVAAAQALGIDVVVTDHHRAGDQLPRCPIVHPAICGYPFEHLCATAVAYKLAQALLERADRDPAGADEQLDLVALATVADVVPLRGENRRLVRAGLEALTRTRRPGLRALAAVAGCRGVDLDEHAVGFRLAPRMNAAGRLQRADAALELVLTVDERRAAAIADELDLLNRERQDTETRILFAAEAARAERPDAAAYVVAGEGWHPGVIGIVASRLVERHNRPCIVIALDADGGRGSGRSVARYDLHAGLAACGEHLRRFGGHRAAAGLEIARSSVEAFAAAFAAHAASVLGPDDLLAVERVDAVVAASDVGLPLAEELERLRPFGHGNPQPTLLVPAARLGDIRAMGDEGQHSRCTLSGGSARARAVAFRTAADALERAGSDRLHAAVRLERNEWRGAVEPRLVLRALCPTERGAIEVLEPEFWPMFLTELEAPPSGGPPATDGAARPRSGRPGDDSARRVIDRRGDGIAGVAGDLVSTGESLLVLCADTGRRRAALERVVASLCSGCTHSNATPAVAAWETIAGQPAIAERFQHLLALDPPEDEPALERARRARAPGPPPEQCAGSMPAPDGPAYLHLAWGGPEIDFARAVATRSLDLRPELRSFFRTLRAAGGTSEGDALERLLRGPDAQPRSPVVAARLVRILEELDLVRFDRHAARCELLAAGRAELGRSPAFNAYRERLDRTRAYLDRSLARAA